MEIVQTYKYLLVIALAWLIAHLIKAIIEKQNGQRKKFFNNFFASGGMPSAHTATVVSLALLIGLELGFNSAIFALAILFTAITMHDAMRVRWSAGENSKAINKIIKNGKLSIPILKINQGHTKAEVMAGGVLGALIAIVVFITT